jgi:hypothetical protein
VELQLLVAAHSSRRQRLQDDVVDAQMLVLGTHGLLLGQVKATCFLQRHLQRQRQQQELEVIASDLEQQCTSRLQQLLQGPEPPLLLALAAPLQQLPSETCPAAAAAAADICRGELMFALRAAADAAGFSTDPGGASTAAHLNATSCLYTDKQLY